MTSTFGPNQLTDYYTKALAAAEATQGVVSTPATTPNGLAGGVTPPPASTTAAVGALGAPALANQGLQSSLLQSEYGQIQPDLQQASDYATAMAGYQTAGQDINLQQVGLQQQGTQQAYGVQQQQYGIQQQQQALNFQNQMQGIIGGEAASGALNTQGSKQQQSTAQQQYGFGQQQLGLQEQLSAGDYARAQQNYGLIGQANGLSQQEVQTRLKSGLQQLGESASSNIDQLTSQMGGVLSGESTGVGSTLSQAGLLGGLNPIAALG